MARTVDPVAHAVRRDSFVDAALHLIQTRGYEQLSLQDVLAEVGASKGAFYHYFDSRGALLAAVVERTVDTATAAVAPVASDPDLTALEKLEGLFAGIAAWKGERADLMVGLLRVWFSDGNAVVRERLRRATSIRLAPLLTAIIRQGVAEGVFTTSSPEGAAAVLVSLIQGLNETASQLFLARQAGAVAFEDVERRLGAYLEALERVLCLPTGSFNVPARATLLHAWFD